MSDMDYIRWRADVLAAQKFFADAARLMNTARLGRSSNDDAVRRVTYELANDDIESACVETWAMGAMNDNTAVFWQGTAEMCAQDQDDAKTAKAIMDKLPDGAVKLRRLRAMRINWWMR